jgi:hypothetical protein
MATREELYAKFGITAEAAQLFETELGTFLLQLRGMEKGWHIAPDGEQARILFDQVDQSTLGSLLGRLKKHARFDGDLEGQLSSALKARNQLIHGFYERHNFKIQTNEGRDEMIADLERLHTELFQAWQRASAMTTITRELMLQQRAENGYTAENGANQHGPNA